MRPTNHLGYLLQHVASLLAKQSDQVLQEQLGIGLAQFKILQLLKVCPDVKQRDVANDLGQTEASISRQVKLMLDDGLLHSIINPKDHRQHLTVPTRKGLRLAEAAMAVLEKYHAPTFTALGTKQHEQLDELLGVLHGRVCHTAHPDPTAHA
ncbi:MAG TPA: MarR family winged helix-turn-helix transcriptional regulator [Candidatus Saccharimonadales bacterium]|nr:MarR family winged helix-turn-helix transcriptional regulator [Candidatus Saccharimonadales bacterium]